MIESFEGYLVNMKMIVGRVKVSGKMLWRPRFFIFIFIDHCFFYIDIRTLILSLTLNVRR